MNLVLIPPLAVPLVLCHSRALSDASFNRCKAQIKGVMHFKALQDLSAHVQHPKDSLTTPFTNWSVDIAHHYNQGSFPLFCYYPSVQCQSFATKARAIVGWSAPLRCARASLQRPSPLFSHLGTWCVLHSSTSVHIHCSLSIAPFLIVSCLVVSSACVCVCLETAYCPCSVYNLQVGWTNSLVSFPHLQSPWCSVTQGPFQMRLLTLSKEAEVEIQCLRHMQLVSYAYDNLNIDLKYSVLTVEKPHDTLINFRTEQCFPYIMVCHCKT